MAIDTGIGIKFSTVSTTQQAPLGFTFTEPASQRQAVASQGIRQWIYVKAGAALVAGDVCVRQAGAGNYGDPDTAATGPILGVAADSSVQVVGVAQHVIAQNSYGFILRTGIGIVGVATGGCTADTALRPDAGGDGRDVAAITDVSFAWALETVGSGAGNTAKAVLTCVG